MARLSRRTMFVALAVLLAVSMPVATAAPGIAFSDAYDDTRGPSAGELSGLNVFGSDVDDQVAKYGSGQTTGVFVYYSNDSYGSLQSWANTSADRRILQQDADDQRALVTAPRDQLGLTFNANLFGEGLAAKSYVEHIAVNHRLEYAEPVRLEGESAFNPPKSNWGVPGGWSTDGVAYKADAPRTTPADVRSITGADAVAATGENVTVGVCDTGVNTDTGTVFGNGTRGSQTRIAGAYNFVTDEPGNAANGFENVSDGNGHGTWVASAVGANASGTAYDGMAPDANLVIGKALNDDGSSSTDQIADCIEYMEEQDTDILSLSLGSSVYSPVLAQEIDDYLAGNGTVALVAAGNSRMRPVGGRYVNSPADTPHEGVLTIAATNAKPASNASSAYFSSLGPDAARDFSNGVTAGESVDLAAPGMNTTARTIDESGVHENSTVSGTSMATPYTAGATALYLDANPSRVNDTNATAGYLRNTTVAMPNAGTTEVGHGMVNVSKLVAEDTSGESQAESRNADAEARDKANKAHSGGGLFDRLMAAD